MYVHPIQWALHNVKFKNNNNNNNKEGSVISFLGWIRNKMHCDTVCTKLIVDDSPLCKINSLTIRDRTPEVS